MALPSYTETRYRIWHYVYLSICAFVFFFLIAPLFVIFPLSFNAEEFLVFSEGMKNLDPDAFSLRWYKDMVYGTKNPWGLAAKNSFIIAIFATIGSIILGTLAALGLIYNCPTQTSPNTILHSALYLDFGNISKMASRFKAKTMYTKMGCAIWGSSPITAEPGFT